MSHLRLPTLDLPAALLARLHRLTDASGTPGVMYARISEDREVAQHQKFGVLRRRRESKQQQQIQ